jgi:hypothetical protein
MSLVEGKIVPVLSYVTKHYVMKTYWGMEVWLHHS